MDDTLLDEFERPLRALCTDDTLRAVEAGAPTDALWQAIDALGYTDALVAEAQGGAGLSLRELFALVFAAGKAGLGLPFGETAVARALLAAAGHGERRGAGPIAIAPGVPGDAGSVVCRDVPGGALAHQVLVSWQGEWLLLPRDRATATPGAWRPQASATLQWHTPDLAVVRFDAGAADAVALCNALHAAGMAGAMARVLELVTDYARDRKQFGRPIAQFQAIQHSLADMATQLAAARALMISTARQLDAGGDARADASMAKLFCSEAAFRIADAAVQIHGGEGIVQGRRVEFLFRMLRMYRVLTGTSEIQKNIIARELLGEAAQASA